MKSKGLFYLPMLLCLLTAQRGYSLIDPQDTPQTPDSVKVPIESIYYYNAVADSLDFCKEDKATLLQAINEAELSISQRDHAISLLQSQVKDGEQIDQNNQEIIRNYRDNLKREKGKGWIKAIIGFFAGALSYAILK